MIAINRQRPLLRIGHYCITDYDETWFAQALDDATQRMGGDLTPFRNELLKAISYYLEEICGLQVLPLEILHARIKNMLKQIGMNNLAQHWQLTPPPITINLNNLAEGSPYPLFFFTQLQNELKKLRHSGIEDCIFANIRECVLTLESATRWTSRCEKTADTIIDIIKTSYKSPLVA